VRRKRGWRTLMTTENGGRRVRVVVPRSPAMIRVRMLTAPMIPSLEAGQAGSQRLPTLAEIALLMSFSSPYPRIRNCARTSVLSRFIVVDQPAVKDSYSHSSCFYWGYALLSRFPKDPTGTEFAPWPIV
jgi:hypothetical protein